MKNICRFFFLMAFIAIFCGCGNSLTLDIPSDANSELAAAIKDIHNPPSIDKVNQTASALNDMVGKTASYKGNFAAGEDVVWKAAKQCYETYKAAYTEGGQVSMYRDLKRHLGRVRLINARAHIRRALQVAKTHGKDQSAPAHKLRVTYFDLSGLKRLDSVPKWHEYREEADKASKVFSDTSS